MIDLKLLLHALALARHRNFGRAAEALGLSQPALSRSIAGLEAALGVKLFDRTRHGVVATAFGERLLARGGTLLTDAAELERELALMRGLDIGALHVGAGPYPAEMSVGPAIGRMTSRHPRLRIVLRTGDWRVIVDEVLHARLDVAVIELSAVEAEPRLTSEPLPRHPAVFFCRVAHPLLAQSPPPLERVFQFPLACTKLPARAAQAFHQLAKTGALDPDTGDYLPPLEVDTFATARSVVLASDAIGVAPLSLIARDLDERRLAALPIRQPWAHTNYGCVYLKDRTLSPAAQAFIAEVKAVEATLVDAERRIAPLPPRPPPASGAAAPRRRARRAPTS